MIQRLTKRKKEQVISLYGGKVTDGYIQELRHVKAPYTPVLTFCKLKTILSSLKAVVDKAFISHVVYPISCSRCNACYDRQTDRHILTRFNEDKRPSQPYGKYVQLCGVNPSFGSVVKILQSTCKGIPYLETLEALWQRELKPQINTKDEFRKRELTIKL